MKRALVLAVLLLMAKGALAQSSYQVSAGSSVQIAQHVGWNSNCQSRRVRIQMITEPTIGAVSIDRANVPIPETATVGTSAPACTGRAVAGAVLTYTAPAGASGTDVVSYRVRFNGISGSQTETITVNIR